MVQAKKSSALQNAIAVLIGALLLGFLWRARGTTGWGSSWGLLNAGFIFSMFTVLAKGYRQKMDFGWLSLTALSFMLTVPSWGTLLGQITGVLYEKEIAGAGDPFVYIPIPSAIFLMLCLGFGLATLFGIMLGRGYSSKQWKIKDFIIVIVVFYAVDLITKASVSHWILDLVQPQAGDVFEKYLAQAGEQMSAHEAFLKHFNDLSWAKKIDGGRNYFSSIQAITSLLRSLAAILAVRFIVKDKVSARTGLVVSTAFAGAITVSDLFFYFSNGGYHMQGESPFGEAVYAWSCWEYFTGFIAGAIITAFILSLKREEDVPEITFDKVPQKANTILTFILTFVFMVGVNFVRPALERFKDSATAQIIATIIAVLVAVAVVALVNVKFGINAQKLSTHKLYAGLFTAFVLYVLVAYMFIATAERQEFRDMQSVHNILFTVSAIAAAVWGAIELKKLKSE